MWFCDCCVTCCIKAVQGVTKRFQTSEYGEALPTGYGPTSRIGMREQELSAEQTGYSVLANENEAISFTKSFNRIESNSYDPVLDSSPSFNIHNEPWYFEDVKDRIQAEDILSKAGDIHGIFLVRSGRGLGTPYVISAKIWNSNDNIFEVKHYLIYKKEHSYGTKDDEQFSSVKTMIESYLTIDSPILTKPCPKVCALERSRTDIDLGEELGSGQFGVVYKGTFNNEPVAIKELKVDKETIGMDQFLNEVQIMHQYQHKRIIKLFGVCTDDIPFLMILEYMKHGALYDYLRANATNGDNNISMLAQVAEGMAFLEQYNIVHRDLAARNILLDDNMCIKISDFGLSRALENKTYYETMHVKILPLLWCPPEFIENFKFTTKADVWMFGILAMEMFTKAKRPYDEVKGDVTSVFQKLKKGYRMKKPDIMPKNIYDMLLECWNKDPTLRPTFATLYSFLRNYQ